MDLVLAQNAYGKYCFPLNCPEECKKWTTSARIAYAKWLPTVAEEFKGKLYHDESYTYLRDSLLKGKYPILDMGQGQYLFYPKIENFCREVIPKNMYSFSKKVAKVQIKSFDFKGNLWQIQRASNSLWGVKEEVVCGIPDEYGCIKFHPYESIQWINKRMDK